MAYSPKACPISWSSARYGHCLGHVPPSADRGLYVSLRKNLSSTLQDRSDRNRMRFGDVNPTSAKFHAYVRLLRRQRQTNKTFTGELFPNDPAAHAQVAQSVGDRLHKAISVYQPAESRRQPTSGCRDRDFSLKKPVYSRDEILKILDKLSARYSSGNKTEEERQRLDDVKRRFRKSQLYYPASTVQEAIVDYVGSCRPSSDNTHRPLSARSRAHSPIMDEISRDVKDGERKHRRDDVTEISARLHDDTSGGQNRKPRVKSAPPETRRNRKATQEEVDEIVHRLAQYDKRKWPPESKDPERTPKLVAH